METQHDKKEAYGEHDRNRENQNGVVVTTLAIISTIMGGGIISIPYAYSVAGFWPGLGIQLCVIVSVMISCYLYL